MNFRQKMLSWAALPGWRRTLRAEKKKLVVTNGCFDILHLGHVSYLEAARNLGEALLVAINSDASVRTIKGPHRPVNPEIDRAAVVAALASVDAVCIFQDSTALPLLKLIEPDIYAKGGDYTLETINQEERRLVEAMGGKVVVLGGIPGKSTSSLLERMSGR